MSIFWLILLISICCPTEVYLLEQKATTTSKPSSDTTTKSNVVLRTTTAAEIVKALSDLDYNGNDTSSEEVETANGTISMQHDFVGDGYYGGGVYGYYDAGYYTNADYYAVPQIFGPNFYEEFKPHVSFPSHYHHHHHHHYHHHKHIHQPVKAPSILSHITPGAWEELFNICRNQTLTEEEMENAILDWARRQGEAVYNKVYAMLQRKKLASTQLTNQLTNLITNTNTLMNNLANIMNDQTLTIAEKQQQIQTLLASANEDQLRLLQCAEKIVKRKLNNIPTIVGLPTQRFCNSLQPVVPLLVYGCENNKYLSMDDYFLPFCAEGKNMGRSSSYHYSGDDIGICGTNGRFWKHSHIGHFTSDTGNLVDVWLKMAETNSIALQILAPEAVELVKLAKETNYKLNDASEGLKKDDAIKRCESSALVDYVPALCTHRSSTEPFREKRGTPVSKPY
uniref:DUF148 domain-containing protein n=1 Tax=Syphacia muris TaxID=451379 RepID=A0A0N5APX9_9BILA